MIRARTGSALRRWARARFSSAACVASPAFERCRAPSFPGRGHPHEGCGSPAVRRPGAVPPPVDEVSDIDRKEAGRVEQLADRALCFRVVAGDEDHAPAAGVVRIRTQDVGRKRIGAPSRPERREPAGPRSHSRSAHRAARARGSGTSTALVASITISPDQDSPASASWTLAHGTARADDRTACSVAGRSRGHPRAERVDHGLQRLRAPAVRDHDGTVGPPRRARQRLAEPSRADDSDRVVRHGLSPSSDECHSIMKAGAGVHPRETPWNVTRAARLTRESPWGQVDAPAGYSRP